MPTIFQLKEILCYSNVLKTVSCFFFFPKGYTVLLSTFRTLIYQMFLKICNMSYSHLILFLPCERFAFPSIQIFGPVIFSGLPCLSMKNKFSSYLFFFSITGYSWNLYYSSMQILVSVCGILYNTSGILTELHWIHRLIRQNGCLYNVNSSCLWT